MACQAYQTSDQMMCGVCKLQWDVGDQEPPKCKNLKGTGVTKRVRDSEVVAAPAVPQTVALPVHVTAAQAFEIARVYETQRAFGRDMTSAMQKAYDTFAATY
jgi:hypothetical protein